MSLKVAEGGREGRTEGKRGREERLGEELRKANKAVGRL